MKKIVIVAGLVVGAIALTATVALASRVSATLSAEQQAAKAASARYQSVQQALNDGYSGEGEPCVQAPPPPGASGAMGIHYVNHALTRDLEIDAAQPEILLYLPGEDGKLELVGVEYFAPALANTAQGPQPWFEATPPPGGFFNPAPSVLGQTFDGPMPGHNPEMPWHYDLHVWFWEGNPAGLFAPFNPALSC
jgi:type II secretory pathway pseudopilin PulG